MLEALFKRRIAVLAREKHPDPTEQYRCWFSVNRDEPVERYAPGQGRDTSTLGCREESRLEPVGLWEELHVLLSLVRDEHRIDIEAAT